MGKIETYLLLFLVLTLSPLSIMTNGGPGITRKMAIALSDDPKSLATTVMKRFWILFPPTTCLTTGTMIFLLETWSRNSTIIDAGALMLLVSCMAFTGYMIRCRPM